MLEDARAVLSQSRGQVQGHAKRNDIGEADEVGDLILGDSVTNVTQQQRASSLGKALLALAIGGPATAGIVMAPAIIEALKPTPVVQPEFTDTDTDTQFELNLGRPE